MQTIITARHCDVPQPLRERAISMGERLGKVTPRPMEMTVLFATDGLDQTAELRLHLAGGEILVAKAGGTDHRTALDRAEGKLRRQAERAAERPRRARAPQTRHPL